MHSREYEYNKNEALISIIIPVYNAEDTIEKCLNSVLKQTYTHIEVILVNDGSSDKSADICNQYMASDRRVKVIHQENGGPSAARNRGIKQASGQYIGFVDADDYLEEGLYQYLYSQIIKHNAQVAACGWYIHQGSQITTKGFEPKNSVFSGQTALFYAIRGGYFDGYLWNKLFDAHLFEKLSNSEGQLLDEHLYVCEDLLLCCQIFLMCDRVYYYPEPLYHYIIQPRSLLRSYDNANRKTEMAALQRIIDLAKFIDKRIWRTAQFKYTQAALTNVKNAHDHQCYDLKKKMRKESHKYIIQSLVFRGVGFKAKLRLLSMYIAPKKSIDSWQQIKARFGIRAWTKANDR